MILISTTTELRQQVQTAIESEYRLSELVTITDDVSPFADILVKENIVVAPVWNNNLPPILFSSLATTDKTLKGIVYARLGNTEKAKTFFSANADVVAVLDLIDSLRNGSPIDAGMITFQSDYAAMHNKAVAIHYGNITAENSVPNVCNLYEELLHAETDKTFKAFSAWQFALLLLDMGRPDYAIEIASSQIGKGAGEIADNFLKSAICSAQLQTLQPPYEGKDFEKLKTNLWECLQFFEKNNYDPEAAETLSDASHIALVSKSYSEALGYITKAIEIYTGNELPEMAAQAQLKKGQLLQSWAQQGNSQFYRSAVQSYQEALKIFTREDTPEIFADIHHQLGIIYADIPDEVKKKGIWASVAVSSFNEALSFYNKVDFPYEFAKICNNMGLAYTKFPKALKSDNFDKALAWYREALDIFTAVDFPAERSAALLNYVDASWFAGNNEEDNEKRFEEMNEKANEILTICTDETILEQASIHVQKLSELKVSLNTIS